jgi:hypothetical protein
VCPCGDLVGDAMQQVEQEGDRQLDVDVGEGAIDGHSLREGGDERIWVSNGSISSRRGIYER